MAENDKTMAELDMLFDAARQDSAGLSAELGSRMIADAAEVQAEWADAGAVVDRPKAPQAGILAQLIAVLGGWPGIGGLAAACAVGVWIGIAPPSDLFDPVQLVLQSENNVELFDGYDLVAALTAEEG